MTPADREALPSTEAFKEGVRSLGKSRKVTFTLRVHEEDGKQLISHLDKINLDTHVDKC